MAYTTEMYSSQFWRLEVQDQGASRAGVWWELSPWVADHHLLAVSSHGLFFVCVGEGGEKGVSSYKYTNPIDQGPTFITSFDPNYSLRGPISKYYSES